MLDPIEDWVCLDVETASWLDLRDVTADVYAQHSSTHIYTAVIGKCYAKDKDSVLELVRWRPDTELDREVEHFLRAGGRIVAWNAGFERAIYRHILAPTYKWPTVDLSQWRDAQAHSLAMGFPASLDAAGRVALGRDAKDMEGAKLMRRMTLTVPDETQGWTRPHETDANLDRLEEYCATDVIVTAQLYDTLAALSLTEHQVWLADQEINERGIYVDLERARKMLHLAQHRGGQIAQEVATETSGQLEGVTSLPALKTWLAQELGRSAQRPLNKAEVDLLLSDPEIPAKVRYVMERRKEASRITSLGKLKRITLATSPDGRVRGVLAYHKAHTGRWASRLLQVHNLPKDRRTKSVQEMCAEAIDAEDYAALDMLWQPLDALSLGLRSLIAAPPGKELIAADYSAIEARVLPWLAGDLGKLKLFANGVDTYVKAAADVGSSDRQLGKVCELALGYGMGVAKFSDTATSWGVPLSLKEAARIQRSWRDSNRDIVEFWGELESAFKYCVRNPGATRQAGHLWLKSHDSGALVYIRLPSGRHLWYHDPRITRLDTTYQSVGDDGELVEKSFEADQIVFYQAGAKGMVRTSTYGGKLAENVTQAVARDCLAVALLNLRKTKYNVVMHVHDSIVAEVDEGYGSVSEFISHILDMPPWAQGLPLSADGYRGPRFIG